MTVLFTDPQAQVIITDVESGEVWHWGSPSRPFLTSVGMSFGGEMVIESFNIGIDVPYDYALEMLDATSTPFKRGNLVKARIGYVSGEWTDWVNGVMQNGGKGLSMSPDGLSGTIDLYVDSTKAVSYTVPKNIFVEAGYDVEKLVTLLGRILGNEIEISDQALGKMNAWKVTKSKSVSYRETREFYGGLEGLGVWDAISRICDENDCKFLTMIRNNKKFLVFITESEILHGYFNEGRLMNKYVLRGILDPGRDQYPCYNFSPKDDSSTWTAGDAGPAASGVDAVGIDTESGEDVRVTVKPEDQEEPLDGKISHTSPQDVKTSDAETGEIVGDTAKEDGSQGTFMSGPVFPGGVDAFENQAKRFQKQGDPGLNMSIATIGTPRERIGNLIQLWGAGVLFNGTYAIREIRHSWSPGNWDTTLNVYRHGWKAVTGEKKETAGGQLPQ
jgi:hypothetical protein